MSSLNNPILSPAGATDILVDNHITVQTAAEINSYNVQYLRRLLRAGKHEENKIGQIWLISLASLEVYLAKCLETTDRRCGPKNGPNGSTFTNVNGQ